MSEIASSSIAPGKAQASQRWRSLAVPSALVLAVFVFAMYDTLSSLFELWWHSDGYGHGFLVLAVCVYLLWLRRAEIAAIVPRPSVLGLLMTGALISVWFVSRILSVLIGEQVILVLSLIALTLALYGFRVAKIAMLPILYLFCAVPIWSYLIPLLQDSTAQAATRISRALGVPIYIEGIHMTIPDGVFLVATICAGISYLLAALSLGAFYALLNLRATWTRISLVVLAFAAGIVFNWIRVAAIVLIGHHSRMQSPVVADHIMFGWVLFLLVIVIVMVCGRFLEHMEGSEGDIAASPRNDAEPAAGAIGEAAHVSKGATWTMALLCAIVLGVPAYASMQLGAPPSQNISVQLPNQLGPESSWDIGAASGDGWVASFQGADSETRVSYVKGQQQVDIQLGYFATQRQGAEAVNNRHAVFERATWRRIAQKSVAAQMPIKSGLKVNELTIRNRQSGEERLVWWWYWIDEQYTADPIQAKLLQMRAIFSGRHHAAVIVMSSPAVGSMVKTAEFMKNWLRDSADVLAVNLRQTSGQAVRP